MTYIAYLTLNRAWLIDPAAPQDFTFTSGTRRTAEETDALDGEVRQYAGQRSQLVARSSELLTVPIQFVNLGLDDVRRFREHKGKLLLLRTVQGERFYGGYLQLSIRPLTNTSRDYTGMSFDVTVEFYEVSYSEAV